MAEKHTVHLRNGSKAIVDADGKVELHLAGPLRFRRKQWICYLMPGEEARRALDYSSVRQEIADMLAEAFRAVPMVVHPEDDN